MLVFTCHEQFTVCIALPSANDMAWPFTTTIDIKRIKWKCREPETSGWWDYREQTHKQSNHVPKIHTSTVYSTSVYTVLVCIFYIHGDVTSSIPSKFWIALVLEKLDQFSLGF